MQPLVEHICLNPNCPYPFNRAFYPEHPHAQSQSCAKWKTSSKNIQQYHPSQLGFDCQVPLYFSSDPAYTQAYLQFNRQAIYGFYRQFAQLIGSQLLKIAKKFKEDTQEMLETIFSQVRFQELKQIAALKKSIKEKSQMLGKIFLGRKQIWQDYSPPKLSHAEQVISHLKEGLASMLRISPKSTTQIKYTFPRQINKQIFVKKEEILQSQDDEQTQIQFYSQERNLQIKGQNLNQGVHSYIQRYCNLSTAEKLLGEPLKAFYSFDQVNNVYSLNCCHCSFRHSIIEPKKNLARRLCAKIILQHAVGAHPEIIEYNYGHTLTCYSVVPVTLEDISNKMSNPLIKKLIIVDRSSSLFFEHNMQQQQISHAVQLLYFSERPHSKCEYMKGGNSAQVPYLLGMLMQSMITLNKKLQIYTSESKVKAITAFCKYYQIKNVRAVEGKGKKDTRNEKTRLQLK